MHDSDICETPCSDEANALISENLLITSWLLTFIQCINHQHPIASVFVVTSLSWRAHMLCFHSSVGVDANAPKPTQKRAVRQVRSSELHPSETEPGAAIWTSSHKMHLTAQRNPLYLHLKSISNTSARRATLT